MAFLLVIRHMPIQGIQTKPKFRFSAQATESHQLHHVEGKKKERNLWTVKNNTGVWCLACQLVKQSGALPPRRVFWKLRYTHQPAQEVKG